MTLETINNKSEHILYARSLVSRSEIRDWFNSSDEMEAVEGSGRIPPLFFTMAGQEYVLKRYARGGVPRFFTSNRYLYTGVEKVRSFVECRMLYALYLQGLPVAQPVAAYYRRCGLYYVAALITRSCRPARPLSRVLMDRSCSAVEWRRIRELLQRFHDIGVCHADLNAHNILFNESSGEITLIDFDRAVLKYTDGQWQHRNIKRLCRSLAKLKRANPAFHFDENEPAFVSSFLS